MTVRLVFTHLQFMMCKNHGEFMEQVGVVKKDHSADGLRGIAALSVVVCHFLIAFYPQGFIYLYPGSAIAGARESSVSGFLQLPLISAFWNGTLAVSLFFVLSGYVLTSGLTEEKGIDILKKRLAKRYFRFCIPVFAGVMLSWFVVSNGLGHWKDASRLSGSWWLGHFWAFEPSFYDAIREALYGAIFGGRSFYMPPLWTMKIEFIGSIIVLSYTALKRNSVSDALVLIVISIYLYTYARYEATYYLSFIAGSYLNQINLKPKRLYNYLILVSALYLGGVNGENLYTWLNNSYFDYPLTKQLMSAVSGFLIVMIVKSGFGRGFFCSKVVQFSGRISFSVYLVHFPVLLSFSSYLFIKMHDFGGYDTAIIINFILTLMVVISAAYIFMKLFDETSTKLSQKLIK